MEPKGISWIMDDGAMEISSSPILSDSSPCCFGALAMFPPPNTCAIFFFNVLPWQCLHNYVHTVDIILHHSPYHCLPWSFLSYIFLIIFIHGFFMPLYNMTVERGKRVVEKKGELWMWKDAGGMTSLDKTHNLSHSRRFHTHTKSACTTDLYKWCAHKADSQTAREDQIE